MWLCLPKSTTWKEIQQSQLWINVLPKVFLNLLLSLIIVVTEIGGSGASRNSLMEVTGSNWLLGGVAGCQI